MNLPVGNTKWPKGIVFGIVFLFCVVFLVGYFQSNSSAPLKKGDPFTQDTWHAVDSTWPGTIKFNETDNSVTLTPMGATPIEAVYEYTVEEYDSRGNPISGSLRMVNDIGQVSHSLFTFEYADNSEEFLHLSYQSGQRPESYLRLSETGVEEHKAKIEQMYREGKLDAYQNLP